MDYDDALELPRDEDGRIVGFLVGKQAAMADWYHKKEAREFEALVAKLKNRNNVIRWRAEVYEENGARLAQLRKTGRDWARAHDAVKKAEHDAELRRNPVIGVCRVCAVQWCVLRGDGRRRMYCSLKCQGLAGGRKISRSKEYKCKRKRCGVRWCPVPGAKGARKRFCCDEHRALHLAEYKANHQRQAKANRPPPPEPEPAPEIAVSASVTVDGATGHWLATVFVNGQTNTVRYDPKLGRIIETSGVPWPVVFELRDQLDQLRKQHAA